MTDLLVITSFILATPLKKHLVMLI